LSDGPPEVWLGIARPQSGRLEDARNLTFDLDRSFKDREASAMSETDNHTYSFLLTDKVLDTFEDKSCDVVRFSVTRQTKIA